MNNKRNPTIVVFCYSWSSDKKPDAFQMALTDAFVKSGFDVHVILANYLAENANIGFGKFVSQDQVITYINEVNADLVLSLNHGGLSKKILQGISCPVVSWIVDAIPHIFHTEGMGNYREMFDSKVRVLAVSTEIKNDLLAKAPFLEGQIFLLAPATRPESFSIVPRDKLYNISFVGSLLDIKEIDHLVKSNFLDQKLIKSISLALKRLKENYYLDIEALINELELENYLKINNWDVETFRMFLANIISNNERFQVIENLHDLGMSLFGNLLWVNSLSSSAKILDACKGIEVIRSHSQLVEVYQASKISINIPQLQVERSLAYRVFDIMASDSLLITKYHPESDFFKVFGNDCPVPMYRNIDELQMLCKYYLDNENLRIELVKKCNDIISRGFSFNDRVKDICMFAGFTAPSGLNPGRIVRLPHDFFYIQESIPPSVKIIISLKMVISNFILACISRLFSKKMRERIIRFFTAVDA